jgi:hypothetical protein
VKLIKEKRLTDLLSQFRLGQVYRTYEFRDKSNNLSRDLDLLVSRGVLKRPSAGMYYKARKEWFGEVPLDQNKLLSKFLKSDDFLLVDYNKYNTLGLGTTQLHSKLIVYNYKRHGSFILDGVKYKFKRVSNLPSKVDQEFLLVDMMNNFKELGEDYNLVESSLKRNWHRFNSKRVMVLARKFGKISTIKLFEKMASDQNVYA